MTDEYERPLTAIALDDALRVPCDFVGGVAQEIFVWKVLPYVVYRLVAIAIDMQQPACFGAHLGDMLGLIDRIREPAADHAHGGGVELEQQRALPTVPERGMVLRISATVSR